eukprot:1153452-Pelagomonas_calceolata.AAC.3
MQQACSPGAPPAAHGAGDTCRGSYEHTAAHPPDLSCTPCMISRLPPDSWNQAESTEGDRVWRPEGTLRSFISFLQSEIKQRGIPKRQLNFNLKSRCSHIATCHERPHTPAEEECAPSHPWPCPQSHTARLRDGTLPGVLGRRRPEVPGSTDRQIKWWERGMRRKERGRGVPGEGG